MTDEAFNHPLAGPLFRHVESLGYKVSVFRLSASMLGTVPACIEAHAVDMRPDPPEVHVVKVVADGDDEAALYQLACALAESAGVRLDG